jgi:hypothetical protein
MIKRLYLCLFILALFISSCSVSGDVITIKESTTVTNQVTVTNNTTVTQQPIIQTVLLPTTKTTTVQGPTSTIFSTKTNTVTVTTTLTKTEVQLPPNPTTNQPIPIKIALDYFGIKNPHIPNLSLSSYRIQLYGIITDGKTINKFNYPSNGTGIPADYYLLESLDSQRIFTTASVGEELF